MNMGKDCGLSKREGWTFERQNIDGELWIPSGSQQVFGVLNKPDNPKRERQPIAQQESPASQSFTQVQTTRLTITPTAPQNFKRQ